jgi:hypothetical protein
MAGPRCHPGTDQLWAAAEVGEPNSGIGHAQHISIGAFQRRTRENDIAALGCDRSRRASNHGARSSSVSGTPADIFATFSALWKSSASAIGQPNRRESKLAMVLMPEPATPITTAAVGRVSCVALAFTRRHPQGYSSGHPARPDDRLDGRVEGGRGLRRRAVRRRCLDRLHTRRCPRGPDSGTPG